jgi:predicted lipid-binding transport protein (Tim44 family)
MSFRLKTFILVLAALLGLGMAGDAFARAGGGFSAGSRGTRTYTSPPTSSAAPIQRSTTPNTGFGRSSGLFGGSFGHGLFGGMLGGFLGAGLFGLLLGHGLFGGFSGGFGLIGLLLQIGVIYLLVRFAMNFFRNRQMAFGGPQGSSFVGAGPVSGGYGGMGGMGGAMGGGGAPLPIEPADYDAFERKLGEVQSAFSDEDLDHLRRLATPEMLGYFSEELAGNARRGTVNKLSGTKLLNGDLAEAWREGGAEYASVRMHFSLVDTMVDRASGRVVSGNPNQPEEATELWTFVRSAGSGPNGWMLSAIQQMA